MSKLPQPTKTPDAETAKAKLPVSKSAKKRPKSLVLAILSSPISWIIAAILGTILFINYFERYTQVGVNSTYKIF